MTRPQNKVSFLSRFRRVTYSTAYLPQVDGLRFLAIFSVVVIMHITNYINETFFDGTYLSNGYWQNFATGGGTGVALFFMVSGFILSLPFARWRLLGAEKVMLKTYFLRRLVRLEPPYLIALAIFFMAHVWVLHRFTFSALLPHFFASAAYLHVLIYKAASPILPVAWSLEVEVQFYILAPLFCTIFLIRKAFVRWLLCALVIIACSTWSYDVWRPAHLFLQLHFFFIGILLADLYCSNVVLVRHEKLGLAIGLAALGGFLFYNIPHSVAGYVGKITCMTLLFHAVLTNRPMLRLFSNRWIAAIGGMCYSIYLVHFAVVSFLGKGLLSLLPANRGLLETILLYMTLIGGVLLISAVFFLLVEKPFLKMRGRAPGANEKRKEKEEEGL